MPVVVLVAAVAVLAGVIAVALGRGGELASFQADYAPLKLDEISATDVVLFRPPMALWGYSAQATDEALNRIADALTERDIEITALRQQVADLEAASPGDRRRVGGVPSRPGRAASPGPPPGSIPPRLRDERASGPLPRIGRPAPDAREADGFGLGDTAAAGPQPRPDRADQPPGRAEGEDDW